MSNTIVYSWHCCKGFSKIGGDGADIVRGGKSASKLAIKRVGINLFG
jgi:hypothetical protein